MRLSTASSTLPFFFFNDTATPEIYTLSLHDALPISQAVVKFEKNSNMESDMTKSEGLNMTVPEGDGRDRKSTRLNSSHPSISYAVFCLEKKYVLVAMSGPPPPDDRAPPTFRAAPPAN